MALRLLLNAGLIAIPIGGSLGSLFGIDAHRAATGQTPLFKDGDGSSGSGGDSTGGGSGGSGSTTNNGVTNTMYCEKSYGITPPSDGAQFTLNPNQWGVTDTSVGGLCMNITTFNNMTYPTRYTAPEFSVTWQFDPGPSSQPVHAYPNIMAEEVLPVQLNQMTSIEIDFSWTYGVGNTVSQSTSVSDLEANAVNTNVAIDMFFDADSATAQDTTKAHYEVMIWFAQIGGSAKAIGSPVTTRDLNGTRFQLWAGTNTETGQIVLTWIATELTESFVGDIYPLITDLYSMGGEIYPSSNDYMGVFSLGTEAYSSSSNVTFWASSLSIDIQK